MTLLRAWRIYCDLYRLISLWAAQYVTEAHAGKIARYSIARVFQLACIAWECTDGPYREAMDVALPMLVDYTRREGHLFVDGPEQPLDMPGELFLNDLCQLYAYVYEMQYFGQWNSATREYISMWLRLNKPEYAGDANAAAKIIVAQIEFPALRRAVDVSQSHAHPDQLVCAAADEVFEDEYVRSLDWGTRARAWKGGEQWPG